MMLKICFTSSTNTFSFLNFLEPLIFHLYNFTFSRVLYKQKHKLYSFSDSYLLFIIFKLFSTFSYDDFCNVYFFLFFKNSLTIWKKDQLSLAFNLSLIFSLKFLLGVRGERRQHASSFKAQRLGWFERGTYRWCADWPSSVSPYTWLRSTRKQKISFEGGRQSGSLGSGWAGGEESRVPLQMLCSLL